jgi:hypothetical protein
LCRDKVVGVFCAFFVPLPPSAWAAFWMGIGIVSVLINGAGEYHLIHQYSIERYVERR